MALANSEWSNALLHSEMAPPDAWFAARISLIAKAAARRAAALEQLAEDMSWAPIPGARDMALSHELRPGANRPGPPELWAEFDVAVSQLGLAMEGTSVAAVQALTEQLALVMHELAVAVEKYRGSYGGWHEPAPGGRELGVDDGPSP